MDIMTSHSSKLSYTEISMAHIRLDEKVRKPLIQKTNIELGLEHPQMGDELRQYLLHELPGKL